MLQLPLSIIRIIFLCLLALAVTACGGGDNAGSSNNNNDNSNDNGNGNGGSSPSGDVTPTIGTQPQDATVFVGQSATFSVEASGTGTLSYQWKKDGTNITDANSSSYSTPATLMPDNASEYTVVVSNSKGNVTSEAATLSVQPALNDTGIIRGGNYAGGINSGCTSDITVDQDCDQGRDADHSDDSDGHAGFSFTKLDASGDELAAGANNHHCVRDNVTGLIWEVKQDKNDATGDSLHDADDTYSWYNTNSATNGGATGVRDAYNGNSCFGYVNGTTSTYCNTQDFVARVNAQGLCGITDWRLPSLNELQSIANFNTKNPSIDTNYFPNTQSSSDYWSSTIVNSNDEYAWTVTFQEGVANNFNGDHRFGKYVRLVHGAEPAVGATETTESGQTVNANIPNYWPDSRYTDHGDGTVTDSLTGLMWKQCAEQANPSTPGTCNALTGTTGKMDWQDSLNTVANHSFAGHSDWRLPNVKELASLAALDRRNPAINASIFPATPASEFWSSSLSVIDDNMSLIVNLQEGKSSRIYRSGTHYVRLVRGGQ